MGTGKYAEGTRLHLGEIERGVRGLIVADVRLRRALQKQRDHIGAPIVGGVHERREEGR